MVCLPNWNLDATQLKGPPECRCVVPGECEVTGENVLDVVSNAPPLSPQVEYFATFQVTDVASEKECASLCASTDQCTAYTFMGELNPLRQLR